MSQAERKENRVGLIAVYLHAVVDMVVFVMRQGPATDEAEARAQLQHYLQQRFLTAESLERFQHAVGTLNKLMPNFLVIISLEAKRRIEENANGQ